MVPVKGPEAQKSSTPLYPDCSGRVVATEGTVVGVVAVIVGELWFGACCPSMLPQAVATG